MLCNWKRLEIYKLGIAIGRQDFVLNIRQAFWGYKTHFVYEPHFREVDLV